jgi:hypothetical protein
MLQILTYIASLNLYDMFKKVSQEPWFTVYVKT